VRITRIFCIGKNYAEHVAELAPAGYVNDGECVVFMKPATCAVAAGQTVKLPRGRGSVHHEAELVVMLSGGGNDVAAEQAPQLVSHLTLGLDLTLRDLQSKLKEKGAPWELAKAFDAAAPIGNWKPYANEDLQALEFSLHVNGELRQRGFTKDMLFPVARQIQILSRTWSLQAGDVIFTGTPKGVGPLKAGDVANLASPQIGSYEWRFS
jgi:2-keto-4-pentenoate hydratase/2-oxohepta-3-ene-1,7-dioic acid hydratase in catechol pathway